MAKPETALASRLNDSFTGSLYGRWVVTASTSCVERPRRNIGRRRSASLRLVFKRRKEERALAQSSKEVVEFADSLIDDQGGISEAYVDSLYAFAWKRGYGTDARPLPEAALRIIQVGLANHGQFLETASTLLLQADEVAYCEVPAQLLKEVTDREFQGGSRGVSVPLGHGIRYRTGSVRGHMVTVGSHLESADSGMLTVTDKRVVYHGARKNLEFAFKKLTTLFAYSDAVTLGVSNRQNTSTLTVSDPEYVTGMIRAAFNASTRDAKAAATPEIAEATDATVHLIEDSHTFEGDDGETIWCGGLAPCTEDGTFIPAPRASGTRRPWRCAGRSTSRPVGQSARRAT
jgi:hypothetical protein